MAKEVKIPDIGGFEGVEIIDVLVSAGDAIEKEDSLITLESDKAAMDVPAPFAGTVAEMKVKTGDKVSEGDVILTVEAGEGGAEKEDDAESGSTAEAGDDEEGSRDDSGEQKEKKAGKKDNGKRGKGGDEDGDKKGKQEQEEDRSGEGETDEAGEDGNGKKEEKKRGAPEDEGGGEEEQTEPQDGAKPSAAREPETTPPTVDRVSQVSAHAGPSVRKFARELGVDLSKVTGSGYKNRITREDVKAHVKSVLRGGGAGGAGLPQVPEVDFSRFGETETKPLSRIKKISGPRLQAAWVNAPHVTQHDEADITAIEAVRKGLNASAGDDDAKITLLAFLVRASVLALKAYPAANSALDAAGENLIERKYFNIGFAVDTEQGLVVPVVRDADDKSLREIAGELAELAEKARGGKLKREEIEGACFSITSLGGIGGTAFTPIVNAPEVAILGVSRARMKPEWNGSEFLPRLMVPLSLSYDHRVVDGAMAARITRHLAETLETLRGFVS